MDTVLEINNLSKSYGKLKAVNNLSLSIPKGSVYGILGPNGSGKTTTLSLILGSLKPDSGSFSWFGKPNDHTVNKKIGALLETPNFYPYLSIIQNLKIYAMVRKIDKADYEDEFNWVLDLTELNDRRDTYFFNLSFGMKQRLALAALLLGNPEVLILDEPTNGLDPVGINNVRELIQKQAAQGKTIILASHILDEVEKVCSHVAILKTGNLLTSGKADELLSKEETVIAACSDQGRFLDLLKASPLIKSYSIENNELHLVLNKSFAAVQVNELAVKNGIVLSKLETRKQTLEENFLEIIKQ